MASGIQFTQPSAGGGGGTNIYNSDGTLTGARVLDGSNYDLTFLNLSHFSLYSQYSYLGNAGSTSLNIDSVSNNIMASYLAQPNGLYIDFNNNAYTFGNIQMPNLAAININAPMGIIQSVFSSGYAGFYIDNSSSTYKYGVDSGINTNGLKIDSSFIRLGYENYNTLCVSSPLNLIYSERNGVGLGLFIDYNNSAYTLGDPAGAGNSTYFSVVDSAFAPTLDMSSNLLTTSATGSSGQHLKVRVGGVDYVIELKNP